MHKTRLLLLRGVCQTPAYVAHEKGYFREEGIETGLDIASTAWVVPERMVRGDYQFSVIPWTRVAAAGAVGEPLVLICGSGYEEAALVVRRGLAIADVKSVAVPQRGGMKDLTAMALLGNLGWEGARQIRQPSGDGAILALVGQGADAASMVEPYATMLAELGIGTVVRRTGDIWPGAPGCSLTTTAAMIAEHPAVVQGVVRAFVRGARSVAADPGEAARIASPYIGIGARFIEAALKHNGPDPSALENGDAMEKVISLMLQLGYLARRPQGYLDLRFAREALGI